MWKCFKYIKTHPQLFISLYPIQNHSIIFMFNERKIKETTLMGWNFRTLWCSRHLFHFLLLSSGEEVQILTTLNLSATTSLLHHCHVYSCWLTNNSSYIICKNDHIHLHITFHIPSPKCSLVTTLKLKGKSFSHSHHITIIFTKKHYIIKSWIFFSGLSPHTISDSMLSGASIATTSQICMSSILLIISVGNWNWSGFHWHDHTKFRVGNWNWSGFHWHDLTKFHNNRSHGPKAERGNIQTVRWPLKPN